MPSQMTRVRRALSTTKQRVHALTAPRTSPPARPDSRPSGKPRLPVSGVVEHFTDQLVVGWISVPADTPPVKVNLVLGKTRVASTFATPSDYVSGARPTRPELGGRARHRRRSDEQIRVFSFRVADIWQFCRRTTKVSVRVRGRSLPINGRGMYRGARENGPHTLADLRARRAEGYVFSQTGQFQLSKQLDVAWQRKVLGLYGEVRELLAAEFGHDAFFMFGTLLGAVREKGFIGHDIDLDAAYVSDCTSGPEAAAELLAIAKMFIGHGYAVEAHTTVLHIHDRVDPDNRIDLFHSFFDPAGRLRIPFGVAGTSGFDRSDWAGVQEIEFGAGRGLIPVAAEKLVRHVYGDDWRRPKPGFNWTIDRTDAAPEGRLSTPQREAVYWANFYAHTAYTSGSTFFELVNGREDTPQRIVDIGCGDGRDSCAFGAAGRTVLGLDRSEVGVEHAGTRAASLDIADRVGFAACDVSDSRHLGELLARARGEGQDQPLMFYLRFFLHSIPEPVQQALMDAIGEHSRPGDYLAAEFRTTGDAEIDKVHGQHYRRFQDGPAFGESLRDRYGFQLLHTEEGRGLSPYKGEDPVLYRVIARR